jgi:hypothetical protein
MYKTIKQLDLTRGTKGNPILVRGSFSNVTLISDYSNYQSIIKNKNYFYVVTDLKMNLLEPKKRFDSLKEAKEYLNFITKK